MGGLVWTRTGPLSAPALPPPPAMGPTPSPTSATPAPLTSTLAVWDRRARESERTKLREDEPPLPPRRRHPPRRLRRPAGIRRSSTPLPLLYLLIPHPAPLAEPGLPGSDAAVGEFEECIDAPAPIFCLNPVPETDATGVCILSWSCPDEGDDGVAPTEGENGGGGLGEVEPSGYNDANKPVPPPPPPPPSTTPPTGSNGGVNGQSDGYGAGEAPPPPPGPGTDDGAPPPIEVDPEYPDYPGSPHFSASCSNRKCASHFQRTPRKWKTSCPTTTWAKSPISTPMLSKLTPVRPAATYTPTTTPTSHSTPSTSHSSGSRLPFIDCGMTLILSRRAQRGRKTRRQNRKRTRLGLVKKGRTAAKKAAVSGTAGLIDTKGLKPPVNGEDADIRCCFWGPHSLPSPTRFSTHPPPLIFQPR